MLLIVVKSWYYIGVCLILGLVGLYDDSIQKSWYCCKVYQDINAITMIMYVNVPYYEMLCNVLGSLIWIVMKGLYSCNSYWAIDDHNYERDRPYDLN